MESIPIIDLFPNPNLVREARIITHCAYYLKHGQYLQVFQRWQKFWDENGNR